MTFNIMEKQPSCRLKSLTFPECYKHCLLVEYLGIGECENCCPEKFKDVENKPETGFDVGDL